MQTYELFRTNAKDASRLAKEKEHEYRDAFQRDRDRLLYSTEFRRLSGKTQLFVSGFDDNMRTRLTHTLEVAQISDTLARRLGLNDVLVEAIAYGHDVGHTPFGHVGERTLNHFVNGCDTFYDFNTDLIDSQRGFKHNLQSLVVAVKLEKISNEYSGLNLTNYTLWGMQNHTKSTYGKCKFCVTGNNVCRFRYVNDKCPKRGNLGMGFYTETLQQLARTFRVNEIVCDSKDWSFEGIIVALADEIAQRHHDVEDGLYAGILDPAALLDKFQSSFTTLIPKKTIHLFSNSLASYKMNKNVSAFTKEILNFYCTTCIALIESKLNTICNDFKIVDTSSYLESRLDIYNWLRDGGRKSLSYESLLGKEFTDADEKFKSYISDIILKSDLAQRMDGKATYIIRKLYHAFLRNPQQLPDKTLISVWESFSNFAYRQQSKKDKILVASSARKAVDEALKENSSEINEILLRTVCDHIAGMTDNYALSQFKELYGANEFKNF